MSTKPPVYQQFVFESYSYDSLRATAQFRYSFDGQRQFCETVTFSQPHRHYNRAVLERALQLSFLLAGTSYYKAFPTQQVLIKPFQLTNQQATFCNQVYRQGLSQFIFENQLSLEGWLEFSGTAEPTAPPEYEGEGRLALQSGGKDSLLLASLLEEGDQHYQPWYLPYGPSHPAVLDSLAQPLRTARRHIDTAALKQAKLAGGLDGHIPITFIILSYALIDAILHNENTVLVSIGAEGAEPHEFVGDLAVNHQWSKSWPAEQLLVDYVQTNLSPQLLVGSPLRGFSELKIAELFATHAWQRFGHSFSSCNRANYTLGSNNQTLQWCGECPKCANSFLLFAPFIEPKELQSVFGGQNLFAKPSLTQTFKGLFGVDGVMKPLECVGEIAELRLAFQMAQTRWGSQTYQLPFTVPASKFDYKKLQPRQAWTDQLLPARVY